MPLAFVHYAGLVLCLSFRSSVLLFEQARVSMALAWWAAPHLGIVKTPWDPSSISLGGMWHGYRVQISPGTSEAVQIAQENPPSDSLSLRFSFLICQFELLWQLPLCLYNAGKWFEVSQCCQRKGLLRIGWLFVMFACYTGKGSQLRAGCQECTSLWWGET